MLWPRLSLGKKLLNRLDDLVAECLSVFHDHQGCGISEV